MTDDEGSTPRWQELVAELEGCSVEESKIRSKKRDEHRSLMGEILNEKKKFSCFVNAMVTCSVEIEGPVDSKSPESVSAFLRNALDAASFESGIEIDENWSEIDVVISDPPDSVSEFGRILGTIKAGEIRRLIDGKYGVPVPRIELNLGH